MRAPRTLPLTLALAGGLGLCSPQALAAPPGPGVQPMHVLEFATDDADDQAKALTIALKGRVKASKDYSLAEGDHSLGVFLAALKCGDVPDTNCQGRIAEKLNADRYIWGTLRHADGKKLVADLHLWQKGQAEVRQQFTLDDNLTAPEDPNLQRLADQMLGKLVTFGKVGTARVTAPSGTDGDLFVDGQMQGKVTNGQTEVSLPVGEHRFEVRSGGKVVAQGSGKVGPSTPLDVELTAVKSDQIVITPTKSDWKKTAGYVGVGVGGAMILGGAYMGLWALTDAFGDDSLKTYAKSEVKSDEKVCDIAKRDRAGSAQSRESLASAKDLCSKGETYQTLQWVLFPVGGLLVAGGAYLLYTSSKEGSKSDAPAGAKAKPRFEVRPMVGQQGGFVDLRVTF